MRDAMRAAVADLPGSEAFHLDFYDRTRMATWVNENPGMVLWVRERIGALAGWRPLGKLVRWPGRGRWRLSERRHRPAQGSDQKRIGPIGSPRKREPERARF